MARTGTSVYPGAVDSFTRIGTANYEDEVGYEIVHVENEAMDALEHIEAVMGTSAGTSVLKNVLAGQFVATTAGTETLTNKTINNAVIGTSSIIGGTITSATIGTINNATIGTPAITGGTISTATIAGATLTTATISSGTASGFRIAKRVGTSVTAGTHTIDVDSYDMYVVTAQGAAVTFATPSGTPTHGQPLVIRIKDSGTAVAITWGTIFRESSDLVKGTTTIASKTLYHGFIYNSTDSTWDCLAVQNNF